MATEHDWLYQLWCKQTRVIPDDQAYYWASEWQEGEREADEDLKAGRVKTFGNAADAIDWLKSDASNP